MGVVTYYQYLHILMLNQDGDLSNTLPQCHFNFKASKNMTQTLQHSQNIWKEYTWKISINLQTRIYLP